MTEKELLKNIKDKEWRINNLYLIKNAQGKPVIFKMNKVQRYVFDNLHSWNVILKARQLGITTFICILYLDAVIFEGLNAGFIAHTLKDAQKIFDEKIMYAWDNLPEVIKSQYEIDTKNVMELKIRRGGIVNSIYVGTSFRGGTLQRLHISELSSIDQTRPDRSREIKTGAFNTVHEGAIVTVESTAKGTHGLFYDICQAGMENEAKDGELGQMDWMFFFFPWWEDEKYSLKGDYVFPIEIIDYFNELRIKNGIELTKEQQNWYYKKLITMTDSSQTSKEDMMREFPSTPEESFSASIQGAYYKTQMTKILEQRRIREVPYQEGIPVDTYWDLGTSSKKKDATSIVFVQQVGPEIHIIDFYGNNSEGLAHYVNVLQNKGYIYGRHFAPHDIEVVELGTGKSRWEIAAKLGLRFNLAPNLPFNDGIEATRQILSKCWFDEQHTQDLIMALRSYRKEWDDKKGVWKDRPFEDFSCDPCDAMRMMAVSIRDTKTYSNNNFNEEKREFNPLNPFTI